MRKLIALDLDGTLLRSDLSISATTIDCLREVTAEGHLVTIATGRSRRAMLEYASQLNLKKPFIVLNGVQITDLHGEIYNQETIDPELARQFWQYCQQNNITCTVVTCEDTLYINSDDSYAVQMHRIYDGMVPHMLGEGKPLPPIVLSFFLVFEEQAEMERCFSQLHSEFNSRLELIRVGNHMLDILPMGITKGHSIKILAEMLGFAPDDIIAFGDNDNDIELLRVAGTGVAMAHATPGLLAVADVVTGSNDDEGIVIALKKLL